VGGAERAAAAKWTAVARTGPGGCGWHWSTGGPNKRKENQFSFIHFPMITKVEIKSKKIVRSVRKNMKKFLEID
jgi:hypothetical protein